jgi:hypothetical protein
VPPIRNAPKSIDYQKITVEITINCTFVVEDFYSYKPPNLIFPLISFRKRYEKSVLRSIIVPMASPAGRTLAPPFEAERMNMAINDLV